MITSHIDIILLVSGIATMSLFIQAFSPKFAISSFYGRQVDDSYSLFLARAGGLPVGTLGALMVWAAYNPSIQLPIIIAVLASKTAFIFMIAFHWKDTGRGYLLTLFVDGVTVMLLATYLYLT